MEVLMQETVDGAWDSAFLAAFQGVLMLLYGETYLHKQEHSLFPA